MNFKFYGARMHIAIITGGSKGLGLALTRDLTAHGWKVITDGRDAGILTDAHAGTEVVVVPGDINDVKHRAALVSAASGFGRLDLLVNNAGTLGPSPLPALADIDPVDLLEVYRVNAVAPLALVQAALPLLRSSTGAVVNVTSDASVQAYAGWGGYGSSKAALDQLTAVLAEEEPAVRFWSLDPGDMRTQMHQDAFPGEDISDRPDPASVAPVVRALLGSGRPSGRIQASALSAEAGR